MGTIVINFFGGVVPLSMDVTDSLAPMILAGPATTNVDSNPGDIDATGVASGGTLPHAYAWTVAELSDTGNCLSILSAGTQNASRYNTLTIRSVVQAGPPTNGQYSLTCTVTDGIGATAVDSVNFDITSLAI